MSKQPFPSQTQDRFIVRLPDGLRDRIAAAAKANGRSMNAEIVHVLEARYPPPPTLDGMLMGLDLAIGALKHYSGPHDWHFLEDSLSEIRKFIETNPKILEDQPDHTSNILKKIKDDKAK